MTLWLTLAAPALALDWSAPIVIEPVTAEVRDLTAADLDGDGDLDLLMARGPSAIAAGGLDWYANDGLGGFGPRQSIASGELVLWVQAGDADGDGDLDLATAQGGTFYLRDLVLYENLGGSGFGAPRLFQARDETPAWYVWWIDADNDGNMDLVQGGYWGAYLHRNDGPGPSYAERELLGGGAGTVLLRPSDIDGDGQLDLFASVSDYIYYPSYIGVYAGTGDGFGPELNILRGFEFTAGDAKDIDGDGDTDLVADRGGALIWHPAEPGGMGLRTEISVGTNYFWLDLVDIDGDGDQDIVGVSPTTIGIHENDGTGVFADPTWPDSGALTANAVADFTGDGLPDLVVAGTSLRLLVNSPTDADGDGSMPPADCDDADRAVHPGATELCNGIDDDCDGEVDEDCPAGTSTTPIDTAPPDNRRKKSDPGGCACTSAPGSTPVAALLFGLILVRRDRPDADATR